MTHTPRRWVVPCKRTARGVILLTLFAVLRSCSPRYVMGNTEFITRDTANLLATLIYFRGTSEIKRVGTELQSLKVHDHPDRANPRQAHQQNDAPARSAGGKNHILLVDDAAICREPVAYFLTKSGYNVTCAANGREALDAIQSTPPDLILLDLLMPVMDGLSLLRTLHGLKPQIKIPVLLLTAVSDKKHILEAAKLGVSGYMLKTRFSLDDLLTRIRQKLTDAPTPPNASNRPTPPPAAAIAVAASTAETSAMPDSKAPDPNEALAKSMGVEILYTRETCLEYAKKALHGKALSGVVAQVIQIATSSRSDAAQLGESISHDPILSAKVLRVGNSTAYATSRGPVTNVFDAIKKIGFSTVRNIAATVGIIEAMPAGRGRDGFDPIRSWQHSFAVAMLAERLVSAAQNGNQSAAAVGYLAGLCHDLGEILFQTCFGEECRKIQEAHERTGHSVAELEKVMMGIPTSELIGLTLRSLSLPDAIRDPIEAMHGPAPTKDSVGAILCLADTYANGMLLAASPKSPLRGFTTAECEAALKKNAPPNLDRAKIRGEIFALTMLLSQISDPNLTAPLFPPAKSTIWLAREPALSKLDPVEVALESLAKIQSKNRLPTPEEAGTVKAIVIEATDAFMGPFASQNIAAFKAGCKTALPILWLVHQCEGSVTPSDQQPQPTLMPVPLDVVAKFVAAA
jgi:HD-like signal output (HDOD) protein/CheY-like chemotaxis protein